MQHPILAKMTGILTGSRNAIEQLESLDRLHFRPLYRIKPQRLGGPNGITLNTQERCGHDREHFELHGKRFGYSGKFTAADVRRQFRRLRPQEAAVLDGIDQQITDHEAALRQLRSDRAKVLKEAFAKGHMVTVKEVLAIAEQNAAARSS